MHQFPRPWHFWRRGGLGLGGNANLSTGGGNVDASDLAHTLQFSTDGGDVDGNGLSAPHVTTYSGGGNVTLVFTSVPTNLKIISDGGDISIVLPRDNTRYAISRPPTAATTARRFRSARPPPTRSR